MLCQPECTVLTSANMSRDLHEMWGAYWRNEGLGVCTHNWYRLRNSITVFISFSLCVGTCDKTQNSWHRPFTALKKRKKERKTWRSPFVSNKAQLNSSLLTQHNNQKLTGPQLPGMMSQNSQEGLLLSWARVQLTQFFLPLSEPERD